MTVFIFSLVVLAILLAIGFLGQSIEDDKLDDYLQRMADETGRDVYYIDGQVYFGKEDK